MKKSLFFYAAATALMLTACSSEDDILQTGQTKQVAPQEVGFDVYTQSATDVTRAGLEGTMTTGRLQRSEQLAGGFGVYAFLVEDKDNTAGATGYQSGDGTTAKKPDFMVNEKVLWNTTNQGWYYSPLKYWPNETNKDSQTPAAEMEGNATVSTGHPHLDRLTFFAYAPYVKEGEDATGITGITDKDGELDPAYYGFSKKVKDPSVTYKAELSNPNKVVDLVWGVAPSGGLNYTAVNGTSVTKDEGLPLIDMTKPDVNTSMKFLFQHALARIGITAVAAIDQVSPGGKLDENTKITIKEITLTGNFGRRGILDLNNAGHANVANWTMINETPVVGSTSVAYTSTLTLGLKNIAEHLRFVGTHDSPVEQTDRVGVTTVRQSVIAPSAPKDDDKYSGTFWSTKKTYTETVPYSESTPFFTNEACTSSSAAPHTDYRATATIDLPTAPEYLCTVNSQGEYKTETAAIGLKYPNVNKYYVVTFKKVADTPSATDEIATASVTTKQAYTRTGSSGPYTFTPRTVGLAPVEGDYVITTEAVKATALYPATNYWTRDANYFMVVPTDNILEYNTLTPEQIKALHTVTVKIEYYITTLDNKLADGLTQTKNVVVKDVVFPSIANGKSYNLNLVLGLTSVKMEAEVDDWKFANVQGDLPQNTAGE